MTRYIIEKSDKAGRNKAVKVLFSLSGLTVFILTIFTMLPAQGQDSKVKDLKIFYRNHCVKCHGIDGSARGEDGKELRGQNFTDREWQNETRDEKMVKTILNGKFFGLAMPDFEDMLTEEEAKIIVTEIIRKSEKGKVIAP